MRAAPRTSAVPPIPNNNNNNNASATIPFDAFKAHVHSNQRALESFETLQKPSQGNPRLSAPSTSPVVATAAVFPTRCGTAPVLLQYDRDVTHLDLRRKLLGRQWRSCVLPVLRRLYRLRVCHSETMG